MPKINIGCGKHPSPKNDGWINLDLCKLPGVDVVHDINNKLPFQDSYFDYVYCSHVVEHLNFDKKLYIINEFWRITKPGGRIEILAPNWQHRNSVIDPMHCSLWQINNFDYFVPGHWANYYSRARFKIIVRELRGEGKSELHWILEALK